MLEDGVRPCSTQVPFKEKRGSRCSPAAFRSSSARCSRAGDAGSSSGRSSKARSRVWSAETAGVCEETHLVGQLDLLPRGRGSTAAPGRTAWSRTGSALDQALLLVLQLAHWRAACRCRCLRRFSAGRPPGRRAPGPGPRATCAACTSAAARCAAEVLRHHQQDALFPRRHLLRAAGVDPVLRPAVSPPQSQIEDRCVEAGAGLEHLSTVPRAARSLGSGTRWPIPG